MPVLGGGSGIVEVGGRRYIRKSAFAQAWKRAFDIAAASVGLLLGAPLFLLIGLLIKLGSPGPVFFRQTRVGRHRRPFEMRKFRKMYEDLPAQGPMLTSRYDFRLTPVGRLLERTKLDELPQLINVLVGDMSVVGPRPEVPKFVEIHADRWDEVLSVKPGIFGPNQLRNRNESELFPPGCSDIEDYYLRHILPEKLDVDAHYARRAGLHYDLWLLARGLAAATLGTVTWRTLRTRRLQIANFLTLWAIGTIGMIAAQIVSGQDPLTGMARSAILMAFLAKPLFLLLLRVPRSLPSSMTAEDSLRALWCGLGSAAAIVFGMVWLGYRDMGRLALILDTSFFLGALWTQKLLLYNLQMTFRVQRSRLLARRMIWASVLIAPASVFAVVTLRHGIGVWSEGRELHLSMLLLATLVRPCALLLLRAPLQRAGAASWLVSEWPSLLLASVAGSGLIIMGSLLLGQRMVGRGDILLDAAVFTAAMTGFSLWQNARLAASAAAGRGEGTARRKRLVVIGSGIELSACVGALATLPEQDYEIAGVLTPHELHRTSTVGGHVVLGEIADLADVLAAFVVDTVVLLGQGIDEESRDHVMKVAGTRGVRVASVSLLAGIVSPEEPGGYTSGEV